jgi:hypothetical protein
MRVPREQSLRTVSIGTNCRKSGFTQLIQKFDLLSEHAMPLMSAAILIAALVGTVETPHRPDVTLAQSTNPAVKPQGRFGRSYAPPEATNPGTSAGPLLKTPGYTPHSSPPGSERKGPPTASDCASGYSSQSGLTRREFNRLCGNGS